MNLASRGNLLSVERFGAIWRLNTGFYSDINFDDYQDPDIFVPLTDVVEEIELENWREEIEYEKLPIIYDGRFRRFNGNITIKSDVPEMATGVGFLVGLEYEYDVFVNDEKIGKIEKVEDEENKFIHQLDFKFKSPIEVESVELRTTDVNYEEYPNFNSLHSFDLELETPPYRLFNEHR